MIKDVKMAVLSMRISAADDTAFFYFCASTFLVAIISTPVPAASARITSPICTGASTEISFRQRMHSKILSFGMSDRVLTDTAGRVSPVTRTVDVTVRDGDVISLRA